MTTKYYCIKERQNPQLGTYFVVQGQLTVKEAKRHENPLYGYNHMHKFKTRAEYEAKINELKKSGERVR